MERRHFLQLLVSTAIAGHSLSLEATQQAPAQAQSNAGGNKSPLPWRNWSGSQQSVPAMRVAPGASPSCRNSLPLQAIDTCPFARLGLAIRSPP